MSGNYGKNIKPEQHTNRANFLDSAVYMGQTGVPRKLPQGAC